MQKKNKKKILKNKRVTYGLQQGALSLSQYSNIKTWESATFCVFDAPEIRLPYEERFQFLRDLQATKSWSSSIKIIDSIRCESPKHFREFFDEIVQKKGEGVVLRKAGSLYEKGRSNSMRKYKEFKDIEVKVVKNMFPHGFECEQ